MEPIWALGLMSGTSMDGVDAALLRTDGVDHLEFGPSAFHEYDQAHRELLRRELAAQARGEASPEHTALVSEAVVLEHQKAISALGQRPDVIGFHGQTVFHDPQNFRTVQLGDGSTLSEHPVVWDFRSADVLSGGEGAPLAPFFHFALARYVGLKRPVAFLNLGGVGNVTWVNSLAEAPEVDAALLAFDTGPANALVDDLMKRRAKRSFDADGALAASGEVDEAILSAALVHPYFAKPPPKSLDRDTFADVLQAVEPLPLEDAAATLTAFSAASVAAAHRWFPEPISHVYTCGGGRHNKTLVAGVARGMNVPVSPVEALGLDGDMLEAQAFAYLAVRVLRGLPTSAPTTTGCRVPVSGGRISGCFPSSGV